MDKNFCFGLILGMLGGSLIATNFPKVRSKILVAQEKVKEKLKENQEKASENQTE